MWHASGSQKAIAQAEMPRMLSLIHGNAGAFALDLSSLNVVVPAATGFQAATATLALLAGAESVTAITRPSTRYRSAQEAIDITLSLAALAGVDDRLRISERIGHQTAPRTNILLTGDPIRPVTRSILERLPEHSVIATTREAWMLLGSEIDVEACQEHGVPISAVNETHPLVGGSEYRPALCLQ